MKAKQAPVSKPTSWLIVRTIDRVPMVDKPPKAT